MATLRQKVDAERRGRKMLDEGGLPPPDFVEYGYTCIRFFWMESRAALVIDIDDPPPGGPRSEEWDVAGIRDDEDDL